MAAVVQYTWMFRTAAVLYLLFGVFWIADATLIDKFASVRPFLVGGGIVAIVVGGFLFARKRFAIALSALGAAIVSICAAVAAPRMVGPGILALGLLAILAGIYAVLSARVLFGKDAAP